MKFSSFRMPGLPNQDNMLDTDHFTGIFLSQSKSWIRVSDSVAAGGSAIDLSAAAGGPYTTGDGGMEMADFSETLRLCLIRFFCFVKNSKKKLTELLI